MDKAFLITSLHFIAEALIPNILYKKLDMLIANMFVYQLHYYCFLAVINTSIEKI